MNVEVRLFAGLQRFVQGAQSGCSLAVEVRTGAPVAELLKTLGIPTKEAYVVMVNGLVGDHSTTLQEDDRIGIFPAVGGG